MASKKKAKNKKIQSVVKNQLNTLNINELINLSRRHIDDQKPREAIKTLKQALKKNDSDEIRIMLFQATIMREKQLREKGLHVEADTVKRQAAQYIDNYIHLSEENTVLYIRTCSCEEAFSKYIHYLSLNPPSLAIEQELANLLLIEGKWDLIEQLNDQILLKRDAIHAQKGVNLMNTGKWEQALEDLRHIPRKSPFAHIRLFCRGMVAFYKENDDEMVKAFSMIPDNFPLYDIAVALKNKNFQNNALESIFDTSLNSNQVANNILNFLNNKKFKQAKDYIKQLAMLLYPDSTQIAISEILGIIHNRVLNETLQQKEFNKLVNNLLKNEYKDIFIHKVKIMYSDTPFKSAGEYIPILENEFPNPSQRKIAYALVLQSLAKRLIETPRLFYTDKAGINANKKILGIKSSDNELIPLEIIAKSIKLDPYNKTGYETISKLQRYSRAAKNIVEQALEPMVKLFPDDPYPCLELAEIYYEKNAYRKAENILKEAMKRAPHNTKVIERHALSLLVSAMKNFKLNKPHLLEKDIENAENIANKNILPFIIAKKIIIQVAGHNLQIEKALKVLDPSISLFEYLKILIILILNIQYDKQLYNEDLLKKLNKIFQKEMKKIDTLTAHELLKLFTPFEKEFAAILPYLKTAPVLLENSKNLFKNLNDSDLISLFNIILEPCFFNLILKEAKKRGKKKAGNNSLIFKFYAAVINHIQDNKDETDTFFEITEKADPSTKEVLRSLSRKFAKFAEDPLKAALEKFDFRLLELLDRDNILDNIFNFYDEEDYDDDYDDFEDGYEDFPPDPPKDLLKLMELIENYNPSIGINHKKITKICDTLDNMIENTFLKEAPNHILMIVRDMLMAHPHTSTLFDIIARMVDRGDLPVLSKEVSILIYGTKKQQNTTKRKKR